MKKNFLAGCALFCAMANPVYADVAGFSKPADRVHPPEIVSPVDNPTATPPKGNITTNIVRNPALGTVTAYVARFVSPSDADFIVSSFVNTKVKNMQGETIGEVKDLVIRNERVTGIIVSVGGFLGMGERYVVIDPATISMAYNNGRWSVQTDATKESLKSAPEFKYQGRWAR